MERHWRLILDDQGGSALNMAVDEAILRACSTGEALPTLRLYGWKQPAVSLGYFQRVDHARLDTEYCRAAGVGLVRRPTGGRAVLHGHDITFSICLDDAGMPDGFGSVRGSHLWLMSGIMGGLRFLGIQSELGSEGRDPRRAPDSADCFAHVAECDLRVGCAKVAGAAQVRRWGSLLEQGSIPHTHPDVDLQRVFGGSGAHAQDGGFPLADVSRSEVEQAIVRGFEQSLQVEFEVGKLSEAEASLALDLERGKYALAEWTYRLGPLRIDNYM